MTELEQLLKDMESAADKVLNADKIDDKHRNWLRSEILDLANRTEDLFKRENSATYCRGVRDGVKDVVRHLKRSFNEEMRFWNNNYGIAEEKETQSPIIEK